MVLAGSIQVVERLLSCPMTSRLLKYSTAEDMSDNEQTTCLHLAARNGHVDIIRSVPVADHSQTLIWHARANSLVVSLRVCEFTLVHLASPIFYLKPSFKKKPNSLIGIIIAFQCILVHDDIPATQLITIYFGCTGTLAKYVTVMINVNNRPIYETVTSKTILRHLIRCHQKTFDALGHRHRPNRILAVAYTIGAWSGFTGPIDRYATRSASYPKLMRLYYGLIAPQIRFRLCRLWHMARYLPSSINIIINFDEESIDVILNFVH